MEYVTEAMDPSQQKDFAKALLQERANIKDFICQVFIIFFAKQP